jgi:hypothetical protein
MMQHDGKQNEPTLGSDEETAEEARGLLPLSHAQMILVVGAFVFLLYVLQNPDPVFFAIAIFIVGPILLVIGVSEFIFKGLKRALERRRGS